MSDPGNEVFGLGTDISSLMRISPRLIINSGKVRVAVEMEYTKATYGADYDEYYIPDKKNSVANLRGLLAIYYFF